MFLKYLLNIFSVIPANDPLRLITTTAAWQEIKHCYYCNDACTHNTIALVNVFIS